ncbi:SusE domain-containing protein [Flavobacterium sedimenticola]|uniref:SusE domain-containing protein n=1 Tax=Flavobacterium sedimenticola TaxID=3043286 RepID=A0ABT6XNT7_9FLAO|nr:SusE domain-containing protein [Flavobacterium sedimenticola]MDI9256502.1 SusE domain-containing protein [Flavobacterium sedimenticola]
MKNIFRNILAVALISGFASCTDEQDLKFLDNAAEFKILSPVSGEGVVLSPETPTNPGLSMTWEDMDYGTPTQVTYTVQVDKSGDNFDTPFDLVSTNNTYVTVTSDALNGATLAVGLTPFTQGGLEIRVKSTVGQPASEEKFSDVITYLVTPYSSELPKLAVPGNHQGWNPPTAPRIASSAFGQTDYEGYIWLDGGFKFVGPDPSGNFNWGNTDWGDDGSFSGVLVESGESDCTATAGYYRVRANTTTLLYTVEPTTWGIVGAATPGGWDNSTALTYNASTQKWEGVVTLSAGEFKFRANNAWTINFGGDPDGDGSMNYDGPNLSVDAGGTYNVVLDLSNPRQYTYSVTLQ